MVIVGALQIVLYVFAMVGNLRVYFTYFYGEMISFGDNIYLLSSFITLLFLTILGAIYIVLPLSLENKSKDGDNIIVI